MISILFLYAICASTFTLCKAVLLYAKPIFFVGVRMSVAGMLLLLYWIARNGFDQIKSIKHAWRSFSVIIFFHIYLAYICDLWSLQYLTSSQSSFIYNLSPLLTAFFSYIIFCEVMTRKKWLGLLIGFAGMLPGLIASESISGIHSIPLVPFIVLIIGVAAAMYGWIIMRSLIITDGYSPLVINGVGMLGGGILALISSVIFEGWRQSPVFNVWPFVYLTALIIIVANIVFYNMYGYLLARYTATFLSFAGFVTPFFAALFGLFFLGEHISWMFIISLMIVSVGIYCFYQEELTF